MQNPVVAPLRPHAWPPYFALFIILLVLAGGGGFLHRNFNAVSEQEGWVRHTSEVLSELQLIAWSIREAETGARGFLLTRNRNHLQTFEAGRVEVQQHLNQFRALVRDDPEYLARVAAIQDLVDRRIEQLLELTSDGARGPIAEERKRNLINEGRTTMVLLKERLAELREQERRRHDVRTARTDESRGWFQVSLVVTTALGLLAVLFAFRLLMRQQRRSAEEALEQAERAWIQDRLNDLSLRLSGDISLETAASGVLGLLAEEAGVLGAKIFVREKNQLQVVGTFGAEAQFEDPESTLIQEAVERDEVWTVRQIPESYWKIRSSLGEAKPNVLVFIPFKFQGRRLGVMELALFEEPAEVQLRLLAQAREIIGVGLHAVLSRRALQELLERTQMQAEELQSQHEELQTQQEELRSNNEELEQQARAMEAQQKALALKNDELEMAKHDLELKAADLAQSSQYKSEFLAKMSHELRTPLNGLLILSTLLIENKEKNLTEQQRQFAKSIHNAGNDLLILINDILDLSKIEARKLAVRPETFTVGDLFKQLRQNFEVQATNKGLKFDVVAPTDVAETTVLSDRIRLEQILRNFLSNAIKFTEKGGITLSAKIPPQRRNLLISVRDTGIGIPKEKIGVVFEAFEQADSSVSRKYGGTGLGLTIARELAHLLQGEVSVESREGEGSTFSVEIPLHLETEAMPLAQRERAQVRAEADEPEIRSSPSDEVLADQALQQIKPGQKSILIIEDDERFADSVAEVSDSYHFQPIHASNAEVALAILQRHTPDAILLDIKLPGVSGLGLLEMIKRMSHLRHVPVHMISGMDYQRNALRMGAVGYLTKPVTMDKVRAAMSRIENVVEAHVRKVLVVEDDDKQSFAISQLISGEDVQVHVAQTGHQAIEYLKAEHPDCVILDLSLPDMSGFDFLEQLHSLDSSLPPVVIYTGKDITSEEESYLRRYSESIIIKGVRSPERLLDEVNLFLHRVESLLPQEKRNMLTQLRSQEQTFSGKTVLVVDDDYRNLFALTSALEAKSLNVRIAKDGVEALEVLERYKDVDVVLMDIMMPRMDGFEAMRKIRASGQQRLRALPIIALTAKAMREDHERCIAAGASDYLPKPVNLDHLVTALKVWLSPKEIFV